MSKRQKRRQFQSQKGRLKENRIEHPCGEPEAKPRGQTLIQGALILSAATIVVKIIGMIFRIPLANIIEEAGMGYFSAAYALYTPIYTIAASGFTSALSRIVSENIALKHYRDVRKTHTIAKRIFLVTGSAGFLIMSLGTFIYINFVDEKSVYAILAMCPSVFFCCMMAAYRGYYEGTRNMFPTAISQVIEALCKLVLGLGFSFGIVTLAQSQYAAAEGGVATVFGEQASSAEQALMISYKFAAAGAILGITIGSLIGFIYLRLHYKLKGDRITDEEVLHSPQPQDSKTIFKRFLTVGLPIVLGTLVLNLTQLIDAATIQARLRSLDLTALRQTYIDICAASGINFAYAEEDVPNALYGAYNYGISIYNLVPYITQALGISALPAIASAWVSKNYDSVKQNISGVIKIIVMIGVPAGLGIFALAGPILQLLYPNTAAAIICEPMLKVLGIMVVFGSLVTPMNSMLQAVGKQTVPVKLMLVGAAIKILLNYSLVGVQSINIKGAPAGSTACYLFIIICSLIILTRTAKVRLKLFATFGKPVIAGAACAATAWLVNNLLESHMSGKIAVLLAIVAAAIVYLVMAFILRMLTKDVILMLPKGEKIAKILEKCGRIS